MANTKKALKGRHSMSQSFAKIIVHLVFSTKNREAWLVDGIPMNSMPISEVSLRITREL
jgi:hypothetical protein